jgi:predicted ester cyclase
MVGARHDRQLPPDHVWSLARRGTHQGETEAFGPATGRQMEITGITIKRVSEGKIAEAWTNFDALGMMQQLGMIPEAAEQQN